MADDDKLWVGPLLPDSHERIRRRGHLIEGVLAESFAEEIFNAYGDLNLPGVGKLWLESPEEDPDSDPNDTIILIDYEGRRWQIEIDVWAGLLPPLKPLADPDEESREPGPGQLALTVD